ncbi:MAG: glycosyltransferase family 2 protein [Oscillospiraceae bacterium]|nr:glycosyltransferase family 2 protein [Oscillospiraceae bacterium]
MLINSKDAEKSVKFSIVIPMYNEEEVIGETYRRVKTVMENIGESYEMLFVNDGSSDGTMEKARVLAEADPKMRIISLSRNFGHQIAVTAGMDAALGEAIIVIDADLQDPPEVIPQMIEKWKEGWQIVYGKREKRKGETLFKKVSAKLFYRFINSLTDIEIPVDTGDFRLIDRRVCDAMKILPERNRYVRGLVTWTGFRQIPVEYTREERFAGKTKYSLKKMLRFAADGVTSFSMRPLKIGNIVGITAILSSVGIGAYQLYSKLIMDNFNQIACWAALILFVQGVMMLCMGIQGAYLARIYDETKGRPLYIVGEVIN